MEIETTRPEWISHQEINRKEIETMNMSFKRLIIFPFRYLAEQKLKQVYIRMEIKPTNISIKRLQVIISIELLIISFKRLTK